MASSMAGSSPPLFQWRGVEASGKRIVVVVVRITSEKKKKPKGKGWLGLDVSTSASASASSKRDTRTRKCWRKGENGRWVRVLLLVERGRQRSVENIVIRVNYATSSAAASIQRTTKGRKTTESQKVFPKDHLTGESLERQRRRAHRCAAALFGVEKKLSHDEVEHRHDGLGEVPPDIAAHGARVDRKGRSAGPGGGKSSSELLHTPHVIETGRATHSIASQGRGGEE